MSKINIELKSALMIVYARIKDTGLANMAGCDVYQEAVDLVPEEAWGDQNQQRLNQAAQCDKQLRKQFDFTSVVGANGGLWPDEANDYPMLAANGGRTTPGICLVQDQISVVQRSADNKDSVVAAHDVTEGWHNPLIRYRLENNCSYPEAIEGLGLRKKD